MIHQKDRIRKSESLTIKERVKLSTWVKAQPTKIDAAEILDMGRVTLDRIMFCGSGHPDSIAKIRAVISNKTTSKLIETMGKKKN